MADTNKERERILRILDRDREVVVEGDEKDWKIVGRSGEDVFLIQTGPDASDLRCAGRILDASAGVLYHCFGLHSLISLGYWQAYVGSQDILPDLLAQVMRMER